MALLAVEPVALEIAWTRSRIAGKLPQAMGLSLYGFNSLRVNTKLNTASKTE